MQEPLAEIIDTENHDITLGMIIGRLDILMETNTEAHRVITERLNETDKNVVILKFSRGVYSWLNNMGAVKWGACVLSVTILDFCVRHFT